MDKRHVLDIPVPSDPQGQIRISIFTPPIFIEMGDDGSENLEAKAKEKTGEIVNADEDWTGLSGTRPIDSSVVGGFMFQSDAGTGCSIQVTENENLPIRILIDREQDFSMFFVVVLQHEEWRTPGNICDSYTEFQSQISNAPLASKCHLQNLTHHPQIQV